MYLDEPLSKPQSLVTRLYIVAGKGFTTVLKINTDFKWSDPALFDNVMLLDLAASAEIPFLSAEILNTATRVDYQNGDIAMNVTLGTPEMLELYKLSALMRYTDTAAVWFVHFTISSYYMLYSFFTSFILHLLYPHRLLAADDISFFIDNALLVSVESVMDFTNAAANGAFKYHLIVRDPADSVMVSTNSTVTWTKPQHATWEEAGSIRVTSVFHPLFRGPQHPDPGYNSKCIHATVPVLLRLHTLTFCHNCLIFCRHKKALAGRSEL